MMQNPTAFIFPIVLIALAIFMRVRRSLGFQFYRPVAVMFRAAICLFILFLIISNALRYHPDTLMYNAIGIIIGGGMAYLGVRHAIFEKRKEGIFYRTHIWVEITILTLFFIRLAWRFYQLYGAMGSLPPEQVASQLRYEKDPITGVMISIFATYYIGYFAYIYTQASKIKKAEDNLPNA